jgi:hypothetical protein
MAVQADLVTAHLAADNAFAVYTGNADGSGLTYVGRNTGEWTTTHTFNFQIEAGDYIYLAAWSDDAVAQGIIGDFSTNTGLTFVTGANWQVHLTHSDFDATTGQLPSTGHVAAEIGENTWSNVTHVLDNGVSPWGMRPGISPTADWMWGSPLQPGSAYGEYQIFRYQVVVGRGLRRPRRFGGRGFKLFGSMRGGRLGPAAACPVLPAFPPPAPRKAAPALALKL